MRRVLMATVVVMFAGLGVFLAEPWSQASPAGAVDPGTYPPYPAPGVPAEPIYIWNEDFEETQASAPVALQNFVGKAGAIYSADPTWESTAGLCNGWIVGASGAFSSTSDAGCKTNGGKDYTNSSVNNITTASNVFANGTSRYSWDFLRYQAYVLGLAQMGIGPSAAEMPTITSTSNSVLAALPAAAQQAMGNHVLASETNNGTMTSGQTLQFKAVDVAPAQMGHYYLTSAYFAAMHSPAVNSTWKAPSERFVLTAGTQQWQIAAGINPFTSSTQYSSTVLAPWVTNAAAANGSTITTLANLRWYPGLVGVITLDNATAVQVGAQAFQADAANGAVTLGIEIHNDVLDTTGNDLAIDNPAIIDVTPRLDKSFSPNLIQPGGTSQMSLWITNTTDLVAKPGWNFTDVLPSGVVLDGREPEVTVQCFASGGGAAVASGTCSLADGSCNGLSVAPVPGSGGTASRTFSITASASGTESTGAEDTVTVSGGLADNDAYCTVTLGVINNAITEDQQATLDSGERVPFINTVNTGTPGCADSSAGKLAADLGVPAFTTGSAYGLAGCPFAVLKVEEPNLKVDIAPPVISHLGSDETAPLPLCTDSTTTLLTWNIAVLNAATTTSGSNPDDASGLPADDTGSSPGSDAVNVIVTSDVGDNLTGASWGTPPIGVIATYHTTGGDGQDGRTASVTYSDRNGVQTVSVRPRGEIQDGATVWFIAALPAGQTETVQVSAFVVHQGDTSDTNAGTTCGITNTELTDAANPYVNTVTVTSHDYQQYCSPSLSGVKPGN
ncbi:MAG: hypothetical protein LBH13_03470, partial [Cellulomonadaceae bacterium]|nr:hypothetical protein [Cellulomonadaceae bacterium]